MRLIVAMEGALVLVDRRRAHSAYPGLVIVHLDDTRNGTRDNSKPIREAFDSRRIRRQEILDIGRCLHQENSSSLAGGAPRARDGFALAEQSTNVGSLTEPVAVTVTRLHP